MGHDLSIQIKIPITPVIYLCELQALPGSLIDPRASLSLQPLDKYSRKRILGLWDQNSDPPKYLVIIKYSCFTLFHLNRLIWI